MLPEISLSSMKGKKIFTSEGLSVGEVVRFELDPSIWKVRSIVAEVVDTAMEALELKKALMRPTEILIGKELVKSVGDVVTLNVTIQMLRSQLSTPTSKKQVLSDDRRRRG